MINGVHTLNVLTEVAEERHAQDERWGQQDFPFHQPVDIGGHALVGQPYERWAQSLKDTCDRRRDMAKLGYSDRRSGLLVLLEEVAEAAAETDPRLIRAELLQVAAVAVKLIEALDRAEAKKHGPGCELGPYHGGECGPSALFRVTEEARAAMEASRVPETFRPGSFTAITRETVEHTIRELMADPYKPDGVYSTGIFDDAGPVPPLKPVPDEAHQIMDATLELKLEPLSFLKPDTTDLGDDMEALERARNLLRRAPLCFREASTGRPCPQHGNRTPLGLVADRLDRHFSGRHSYHGSGRLHGICRCGNGSGDQIHRCPDCEHGFHTVPCRELTGTGAPGDVDECGCSGGS